MLLGRPARSCSRRRRARLERPSLPPPHRGAANPVLGPVPATCTSPTFQPHLSASQGPLKSLGPQLARSAPPAGPPRARSAGKGRRTKAPSVSALSLCDFSERPRRGGPSPGKALGGRSREGKGESGGAGALRLDGCPRAPGKPGAGTRINSGGFSCGCLNCSCCGHWRGGAASKSQLRSREGRMPPPAGDVRHRGRTNAVTGGRGLRELRPGRLKSLLLSELQLTYLHRDGPPGP